MLLRIKRLISTPYYTVGELTIDGTDFKCYTLENFEPDHFYTPMQKALPEGEHKAKVDVVCGFTTIRTLRSKSCPCYFTRGRSNRSLNRGEIAIGKSYDAPWTTQCSVTNDDDTWDEFMRLVLTAGIKNSQIKISVEYHPDFYVKNFED